MERNITGKKRRNADGDASFIHHIREELDYVNNEIAVVDQKISDYDKNANVDKTALYYTRHCRERELLLRMRASLEKHFCK